MENYPEITFELIDGFYVIVLGYAHRYEAEEINKIILDHKTCVKTTRDDKPAFIFMSYDERPGFTIIFKRLTEATRVLLENEPKLITSTYPLENGQLFYSPSMSIHY